MRRNAYFTTSGLKSDDSNVPLPSIAYEGANTRCVEHHLRNNNLGIDYVTPGSFKAISLGSLPNKSPYLTLGLYRHST